MTPRRTPAFVRFIVTGFTVGAAVGIVVAAVSTPATSYSPGSGPGYFIVLLGGLGALLAALVAVVLDLLVNRHTDEVNAELEREAKAPPAGSSGGAGPSTVGH